MTNRFLPPTMVAMLVGVALAAGTAMAQGTNVDGHLSVHVQAAPADETSGAPGAPDSTTTIDGNYIPNPAEPFGGEIKLNNLGSKPFWPARTVPPEGAPNILVILTDDTGYGAASTFGGVIPTPTLDKLAAAGLRYTNFHRPRCARPRARRC